MGEPAPVGWRLLAMRQMNRGIALLLFALLVGGCTGGPGEVASTPPSPSSPGTAPAGAATASAPPLPSVSVANWTTIPVTITINGVSVATVPSSTTEDPIHSALPARPWVVEAHAPDGRVLATMTVTAQDYISNDSGRAVSEDLACGRLDLWSGGIHGGGPTFIPDPSKPCE